MKKIFIIAMLLALMISVPLFSQIKPAPIYWAKFTGFVSITGVDTIVGTATDTIIINIHNCYENYYAPADTQASLVRTVWCLAIYANEAVNDSVDWDLDLSLSPDSLHWNYRGEIGPHTMSADSLLLYSITKDADLMEWLRIIRVGGAANDASAGSIGEIFLIWRVPNIRGKY